MLVKNGEHISPVTANASDGQRYWGVAVSLANGDGFTIKGKNPTPLKRAGPVPAVVFAGVIKVFGLANAHIGVVVVQCLLLYFAGLLAGKLGDQYQVSRKAIQALIMFNPSLISLAHHAQSETLFLFFIVILFVLINKILREPSSCGSKIYVFTGLVCGILALTRPLGFYFVLALPFVVLGVLAVSEKWNDLRWPRILGGLILVVGFAGLVMSPWAMRNKVVFGSVSVTQSEGIMMEWHYRGLQRFRKDMLGRQLDSGWLDPFGENCLEDPSCRKDAAERYLSEIFELPVSDTMLALGFSWARLFLNPGVSQIGRYFGYARTNKETLFGSLRSGTFRERVTRTFIAWGAIPPPFFAFLFLGIAYTLITRSLGLVGLLSAGFKKTVRRYTFFYGATISIFLGMYLFSSIARFRTPLEPILALFAVVGFNFIVSKIKNNSRGN